MFGSPVPVSCRILLVLFRDIIVLSRVLVMLCHIVHVLSRVVLRVGFQTRSSGLVFGVSSCSEIYLSFIMLYFGDS